MEKRIIEISNDELEKIHKLQLEILKEIDRICRCNNIKYTLCGGSLLGAVRHQGFIPWDDDIDITMLREEYERFISLCETGLDKNKFFLQTVDTDPEYRLIYGRILLNGTSYIRAGQEHMKSRTGIFVDIFPRDGVSDFKVIRKIQKKLAFFMRKVLYSPVGFEKSNNVIQRRIYYFLKKVGRKNALRIHSLICRLNFGKETEIVACWGLMGTAEKKRLEMGKQGYKEYRKKKRAEAERENIEEREKRTYLSKGLHRLYFEELQEAEFEGCNVLITKYYDEWLTLNYDDYMKLPPVEKRVIHQTVSSYSLGEYD